MATALRLACGSALMTVATATASTASITTAPEAASAVARADGEVDGILLNGMRAFFVERRHARQGWLLPSQSSLRKAGVRWLRRRCASSPACSLGAFMIAVFGVRRQVARKGNVSPRG